MMLARPLSLWLVAQPPKSAAHRGKSRECNVSKQTWNLCQLKEQWKIVGGRFYVVNAEQLSSVVPVEHFDLVW